MINYTRKSGYADLEKRLAAYAAMAAAAALGGAMPAEAAIIFHNPTDATTPLNGFVAFNMVTGAVSTSNSAGMNFRIEFNSGTFTTSFQTTSGGFSTSSLTYRNVFGYGVGPNDRILGTHNSAYRLAGSTNVNAAGVFTTHAHLAESSSSFTSTGPWLPFGSGASGFLGLRFQIAGNTHYGWASLTVNPDLSATLHSFAYEACADQGIHAGSASGGASCDTVVPEPHSATLLALGAAGLVALRRRRKAE